MKRSFPSPTRQTARVETANPQPPRPPGRPPVEPEPKRKKREHGRFAPKTAGGLYFADHVVPSLALLPAMMTESPPEHPSMHDEPMTEDADGRSVMMTQGKGLRNFPMDSEPGLAYPPALQGEPLQPQPPRPSNPSPPDIIMTEPLPVRPIPRWPGDSF